MNDNPEKRELTFEQALKSLEDIVEKMSRDNQSLDDLIVLYEEGIKYLHQCQKDLAAAELKINQLNTRIQANESSEKQDG